MHILIVNAGSSSLKMRLLGPDDSVIDDLHTESWDGTTRRGPDRGYLA
ncbi:MAG TPA: hypothetical protein VEX15_14350 [Nocardioidaceae bacterium]|nr:hypothetical protein [Nocardioidaceae bacterium]